MKTFLNSIGLILTIIGVYVIYINSPINESEIVAAPITDDSTELQESTSKKNRFMKFGVYIVIIGTVLQLISNFIPSEN